MSQRGSPRGGRAAQVPRRASARASPSHVLAPALALQSVIGNRATQRLLGVQAKSKRGDSNDEHERAADRVAEDVTRRRKPAGETCGCAHAGATGGRCDTCGRKTAPRAVDAPGAPLGAGVRGEMERHLDHDFSDVRIHTDTDAARSADALDARAFTVGRDIVFGAGEYAPYSGAGKELIAHELAHVVQQAGVEGSAASAPTLQRKPRSGQDTLPYREAVNLNECVRIMGPENAEFCRREVLGEEIEEEPLDVRADRVAKDLTTLIAGATWKEIRKRVYPVESAAGIERAKQRKKKALPDLSGIGSIRNLEHFAREMRGVQRDWGKLSADWRVYKLAEIGSAELERAGVPGFEMSDKIVTESKGFFDPLHWQFQISEELVNRARLTDQEAGQVANTTMHESRHAEQSFLAARYAASLNFDAAAIGNELHMPRRIAAIAIARKFDANTPALVEALGARMFASMAASMAGTVNLANSHDNGRDTLATLRAAAEISLAALEARVTPDTYQDAVLARNALRAQIAEVERKYKRYRTIPHEADSHEVGDAAELAFKRWK